MKSSIPAAAAIALGAFASVASAQIAPPPAPEPMPVAPAAPPAAPADDETYAAGSTTAEPNEGLTATATLSASAGPNDAPPPPPPIAGTEAAPPPAPPPPIAPLPVEVPVAAGPSLAGWHGSFYLRDPSDLFWFYPKGRLHIDSHSFFGKNVSDVPAADGGVGLKSRLFVRRMRFELAGSMFSRWSFNLGADFAQPESNTNGKSEQYAAKAGEDPTAETARYDAVESVGSSAIIADAWINYSLCDCFNVMLGQYQTPFSLENRTSNGSHTWIERSLAIRGFIVPNSKEIGLTLWGDLPKKWMGYQVGVYAGDGQNRPQIDNRADVLGRVYVRPFAGQEDSPVEKLQIGVSARHGERDPDYVGYDYPGIRTAQGFQLWSPTYKDSLSRTVHVVPSGAQNAIGGELWLPVSIAALQGEAYWTANNTRESIDGYQLSSTNTERLGQIRGLGWYVQLSVWPVGDAFVNGEPGTAARPTKVDPSKPAPSIKKGLEVTAIVSGVNARYAGASRGGLADEKTPGSTTNPATDITIYEYGVGATYWYTKGIRASVNYIVYQTPGSGSDDNLAEVPANMGEHADSGTHILHELSTRLGVSF